jgi:sulfatase modifying factor 1
MNPVRLLAMLAALMPIMMTGYAEAATIDWVTIGAPANLADPATGFGAVADNFDIMKYEWTNDNYVTFLNAVDPDGTNPNSIYAGGMGSGFNNLPKQIVLDPAAPLGRRYSVDSTGYSDMGSRSVVFIDWFRAARVANWLHNGMRAYTTTDSSAIAPQNVGAYTLGTKTRGDAVARNVDSLYWVPNENQWYKAAYFDPSNSIYALYGNGYSTTPRASSITTGSTGN